MAMRKNFLVLGAALMFAACSHNDVDPDEIKALQNKCAEYKSRLEQLQSENHRLHLEVDSLDAIVENVKKWLNNN